MKLYIYFFISLTILYMAEQIENASIFLTNITNNCTDCGEGQKDCHKKINTIPGFVRALNNLEKKFKDHKGPITQDIIEHNTDIYLNFLLNNNNFKEICDENSSIKDAVKVRVELLMAYDSSHDIEVAAKEDLKADLYQVYKAPKEQFFTDELEPNPMLKRKQGGKLTLPISLSRFMKKFAKSKRVTKKKRAAKKTKRKVSKESKKPKSRKQRK